MALLTEASVVPFMAAEALRIMFQMHNGSHLVNARHRRPGGCVLAKTSPTDLRAGPAGPLQPAPAAGDAPSGPSGKVGTGASRRKCAFFHRIRRIWHFESGRGWSRRAGSTNHKARHLRCVIRKTLTGHPLQRVPPDRWRHASLIVSDGGNSLASACWVPRPSLPGLHRVARRRGAMPGR